MNAPLVRSYRKKKHVKMFQADLSMSDSFISLLSPMFNNPECLEIILDVYKYDSFFIPGTAINQYAFYHALSQTKNVWKTHNHSFSSNTTDKVTQILTLSGFIQHCLNLM